MPKITTYKTGPERAGKPKKDGSPGKPIAGKALLNDDGEKIVLRELDVSFPHVEEISSILSSDKFRDFLNGIKAKLGDKSGKSICALYDKGANVYFQTPTRDAAKVTLENGDFKYSDNDVLNIGKNAKVENVGISGFDPTKAMDAVRKIHGKLSESELRELRNDIDAQLKAVNT